jgi:DNA-binding NarL/FixJ family response regulator
MQEVWCNATLEHVIRCLIVDDSAAFLETATRLLERDGLSVVGTANTSDDAQKRSRELHPDVILVDIMLGSESGIDLAMRLSETGSDAAVILISTLDSVEVVDLIDDAPVIGFVSKPELSATAIRQLVGERREQ